MSLTFESCTPPHDLGELIDLTAEMVRLAETGEWDALRSLQRRRSIVLERSFRELSPARLSTPALRTLERLDRVLLQLAEREKERLAQRLRRLQRESGACSSYHSNAIAYAGPAG